MSESVPAVAVPRALAASVGVRSVVEDVVAPAPVAALMAAFGRAGAAPSAGAPVPPMWHGLFCVAKVPPSRTGSDGLPKGTGLPPEAPEFPDRLFGGARCRFLRPLRIGDAVRKESEVVAFEAKKGRRGGFLLARVRHAFRAAGELAVVEENDILLRPAGAAAAGSAAGGAPDPLPAAPWSRTVVPDPVLMFRHSAATFNSHRIHYDRDFARARGHPGLVVQGALVVRLMLELVRDERPDFEVGAFSYRSGRPIHDDGDFTLHGTPSEDGARVALAAFDHAGNRGMTAEAVAVSAPRSPD